MASISARQRRAHPWAPAASNSRRAAYYGIVNYGSGKCLDVHDGVDRDGTPLQQWACTGTKSMRWTVGPNSFTGVHQIKSQVGGRCMDVRAGSSSDGATVQIYHCTGFDNSAQVWSFSPA
ncbi:RICIN domain-containing protein [Micromonospora sp. WMMD980]|uniref:RICIN domain-containing protein n=1 Tax=Micromonospora sp. WMMD980 TaxID=3016088 RepID=UPI0024178739|nr:RICIN domain-containing protein [Micromonospora sp. WMMD980]MDG4800309.1 RICIN domain-containing protein [Micromonospora sp. WMMD980]